MPDLVLPSLPARARRLVYLGSPQVAVGPLQVLIAAGFEVALVISRPDRRRGRGAALTPSPVKAAALQAGLPTSDDVNDAGQVGADLGVVVAFGRLIKADLLSVLPFVNLHFSLLPRWRGAAPVERAVLAGDVITGVCVMAIEEGLDTGGVYRRAELAINAGETVSELRERLAHQGGDLLLDCLRNGFGPAVPQEGEVHYAAKIDPAELRLDWTAEASQLVRVVALERAWTTFRGKRLLIAQARVAPDVAVEQGHHPDQDGGAVPGTMVRRDDAVLVRAGSGWLELVEVQPEGRVRQAAADWRNGSRLSDGELLQ
ncbi:MAG: methionyl-tRNA formyltransferase [Acidimicrobiales bacterium]